MSKRSWHLDNLVSVSTLSSDNKIFSFTQLLLPWYLNFWHTQSSLLKPTMARSNSLNVPLPFETLNFSIFFTCWGRLWKSITDKSAKEDYKNIVSLVSFILIGKATVFKVLVPVGVGVTRKNILLKFSDSKAVPVDTITLNWS